MFMCSVPIDFVLQIARGAAIATAIKYTCVPTGSTAKLHDGNHIMNLCMTTKQRQARAADQLVAMWPLGHPP